MPSEMKYSILVKPKKSMTGAGSSGTSSQHTTEAVVLPGVAGTPRKGVTEPRASPVVAGPSGKGRCLGKNKGAEVAANLAVPPPPTEPILLPGSKVDDPSFLVPDVVDLDFTHALRLSPRFSLPLQAIYTFFHEDTWDVFAGESILDRQRLTVKRQISALELALQNYIELEAILNGEKTPAAIENKITALRVVRDELSTDLEVEKAKVQSLKDSISTEKSSSYKEGFKEGSSKGVETYLSSREFQERQKEATSKAISDFLSSEDFHRMVDVRLDAFKESQELKDLIEGHVQQFKSSTAFEELVNQRLEAYQASAEFEEFQMSLMQSVGEQILDRFLQKRPDVDLSFLDESDSEGVEVVEPAQGAEGVDQAHRGEEQAAGGDGE
ncbi:hypothetical protein L484_004922 [Morus notabilis]|uniref:Uncharacterized protein n=1 Tax=Morus notabilis TaxID=981085 RepID=W9RPL8_9ROSA|nr:hypothetical protein L484_004922 [Morus notabilis]